MYVLMSNKRLLSIDLLCNGFFFIIDEISKSTSFFLPELYEDWVVGRSNKGFLSYSKWHICDRSSSPSMEDIEAFSKTYRALLDEAELDKSMPDNISLEVCFIDFFLFSLLFSFPHHLYLQVFWNLDNETFFCSNSLWHNSRMQVSSAVRLSNKWRKFKD